MVGGGWGGGEAGVLVGWWLVGGWCPRVVGERLVASVTAVEASNILLFIIGVLVLSVYRWKNLPIDVSGVACITGHLLTVSVSLSDTKESPPPIPSYTFSSD